MVIAHGHYYVYTSFAFLNSLFSASENNTLVRVRSFAPYVSHPLFGGESGVVPRSGPLSAPGHPQVAHRLRELLAQPRVRRWRGRRSFLCPRWPRARLRHTGVG